MKKAVSFVLSLVMMVACLAAFSGTTSAAQAVYLDSGKSDMSKMSKDEIYDLLNAYPSDIYYYMDSVAEEMGYDLSVIDYHSMYNTLLYDQEPSLKSPYAPGKVKDIYLQGTTDRLSALRRIAGLPAVEMDAALNRNAQYGAVLLATSGFSHYPAQPDDMDDVFYKEGRSATSSSNIYAGRILTSTPDGFMSDSDPSNIEVVGHRRWQLNPSLKKIGFGYVIGASGYGAYTAEKVFDRSGSSFDYRFVSWPASGNFPISLLSKYDAWSISLNAKYYQTSSDSLNNVNVVLMRDADQQNWRFDADMIGHLDTSRSSKFYNIDTNGYGVANCIIFRPDNFELLPGTYTVMVENLKDINGKSVSLSYQVKLFSTENYVCEVHKMTETAAKEADCHNSGNIEYFHCERCEKYFADKNGQKEIEQKDTVIQKPSHTATVQKGTPATCNAAGLTDGSYCSRCGDVLKPQATIPATGHKPQAAVKENVVKATCTAPGSYDEVVYCAVCGTELSRTHKISPQLAHRLDAGVVVIQPTETQEGKIVRTCADCGATVEETLPKLRSGWITEDGNKYYYKENTPLKYRQKIDGKWYYFNGAGALQKGWIKGSTWMYADGTGVLQTGWQKIGGKWYYFNTSGAMQTGWQKISGKWYYFNTSGAMQTGWQKISGKWYYFNTSGAMQTGWQKISGKWYYFEASGSMRTASLKQGGKTYYFNSAGACTNP